MNNFFKKIIFFILFLGFLFNPLKTEATWIAEDAINSANLAENTATAISSGTSAASNYALKYKELVGDALVYLLNQTLMEELSNETILSINTGGEDGNTTYITNVDKYLSKKMDATASNFLDSAFKDIEASFRSDVQKALLNSYKNSLKNINNPKSTITNLDKTISDMGNNWSWITFLEIMTNPYNNPFGTYLETSDSLAKNVEATKQDKKDDINRGDGFASAQECEEVSVEGGDYDVDYGGFYTTETICKTTTPGITFSATLNSILDLGNKAIAQVDEIQEIVSTIITRLMTESINNGIRGLTETSSDGTNYFTNKDNKKENTPKVIAEKIIEALKQEKEYIAYKKVSLKLVEVISKALEELESCADWTKEWAEEKQEDLGIEDCNATTTSVTAVFIDSIWEDNDNDSEYSYEHEYEYGETGVVDGGMVKSVQKIKYSSDLTPAMINSYSPSPNSVISSSVYSDNYDWKAFDNVVIEDTGGWVASNPSASITFDFGINNSKIVNRYSIKAWRDLGGEFVDSTPKDWIFRGSNDNIVWKTLDRRVGQVDWSGDEKKYYISPNKTSYRYYKLDVYSNNGNQNYTAIQEIEMMEFVDYYKGLPLEEVGYITKLKDLKNSVVKDINFASLNVVGITSEYGRLFAQTNKSYVSDVDFDSVNFVGIKNNKDNILLTETYSISTSDNTTSSTTTSTTSSSSSSSSSDSQCVDGKKNKTKEKLEKEIKESEKNIEKLEDLLADLASTTPTYENLKEITSEYSKIKKQGEHGVDQAKGEVRKYKNMFKEVAERANHCWSPSIEDLIEIIMDIIDSDIFSLLGLDIDTGDLYGDGNKPTTTPGKYGSSGTDTGFHHYNPDGSEENVPFAVMVFCPNSPKYDYCDNGFKFSGYETGGRPVVRRGIYKESGQLTLTCVKFGQSYSFDLGDRKTWANGTCEDPVEEEGEEEEEEEEEEDNKIEIDDTLKEEHSNDETPAMTSATSPTPHNVVATNEHPLFPGWKAFDHISKGDMNGWVATSTFSSITFDFGTGSQNQKIITKYSIQAWWSLSGIFNRSTPKDWTFEGSNNNNDWTILSTNKNEVGWFAGEKQEYKAYNNLPFRYYKLKITDNNGNPDYTAIQEIKMFTDSKEE